MPSPNRVWSLNALSDTTLVGLGVKYGKDSDEYEQAGGTRTSERAPAKKKTPPPA